MCKRATSRTLGHPAGRVSSLQSTACYACELGAGPAVKVSLYLKDRDRTTVTSNRSTSSVVLPDQTRFKQLTRRSSDPQKISGPMQDAQRRVGHAAAAGSSTLHTFIRAPRSALTSRARTGRCEQLKSQPPSNRVTQSPTPYFPQLRAARHVSCACDNATCAAASHKQQAPPLPWSSDTAAVATACSQPLSLAALLTESRHLLALIMHMPLPSAPRRHNARTCCGRQ